MTVTKIMTGCVLLENYYNEKFLKHIMSDEHLNSGEFSSLVNSIETRIRFIIQDSEILLDNGGQLQVVAALYIHAVEEFGKLAYVLSIPDNGGITTINTSHEWFRNHNLKIELAQTILPSECFTLKQGGFVSSGFSRSGYAVHEVPDWKTRLTIFNTDLENGRVPELPGVRDADIRKAIEEFKNFMNL